MPCVLAGRVRHVTPADFLFPSTFPSLRTNLLPISNTLKKAIGCLIPYPVIHLGRQVVHFGPSRCVVGGQMRRADACPICHSTARERLIWFYLSRHELANGNRLKTAQFAPEKGLSTQLSGLLGKTLPGLRS